jgi:YidC/Oxa1 family membrane protein insertase
MEKRALIAFVLSMAVFVAWSFFFNPSPTKKPPVETATSQSEEANKGAAPDQAVPAEPTALESTGQPAAPADGQTPAPVDLRDISVHTDLYTAVFTEKGGRLKSLTVNNYRSAAAPGSPPQDLVVVNSPNDLPLGLSFQSGNGPDLKSAYFKADQADITIQGPGDKATLTMTFEAPDGIVVQRTYAFTGGSYLMDLTVQLRNQSEKTLDDNLILEMASDPITQMDRYAGFGAWIDGNLLEIKPKDLEDDLDHLKNKSYKLTWAGYEDQYFLTALLPADQERTRLQASIYNKAGVALKFVNPPLVMPPQTQKEYKYTTYYGPKDYKILKSMNNELDRSVYFGWFDILSKPLLILMAWLHGYVGNYGVVIILITIMIKLIFWPLTAKSYQSMKGMQKLQPKIMKLREKYKDDRQKMNQEMMQLYRTYKVNPLGGCLPMVIQIPVFIALYRLLDYSLELRHAPFALWIHDLSTPDRLFDFGFQIPLMAPPSGIPVLTLLMGASMLLQQKMTPTPGDPMQAKMMMLMPIFFTFIFINFPSGLVLYWLVNNILSIGQQTYINKRTT